MHHSHHSRTDQAVTDAALPLTGKKVSHIEPNKTAQQYSNQIESDQMNAKIEGHLCLLSLFPSQSLGQSLGAKIKQHN